MILMHAFWQIADEMVKGATAEFNRCQRNRPTNIEAYKESRDVARDNASGIMYVYTVYTTFDWIV